MSSIEVSIVIPVYNSGVFLEETIASIHKQTYTNYEVLIINNGSDDPKTLTIVDQLKEKHRVIHIPEANVSKARNRGMQEAKGRYILLLDSDDRIAPTFLEKCVAKMNSSENCSVVRCFVKLFGVKSGVLSFDDYSFELLLARNLMTVTSLFKKEEGIAVGGFDPNFTEAFEDWEFWINLLKNGGRVETIKEPLFEYRIRKKSRNHSLSLNKLSKARKMIWEKHKALYSEYFLDPLESFEYKLIADSRSYALGKMLTYPLRSFKLMP